MGAGSALAQYMDEHRIKGSELARALGITRGAVSQLRMNGVKGIRTAKRLAQALQCDYRILL